MKDLNQLASNLNLSPSASPGPTEKPKVSPSRVSKFWGRMAELYGSQWTNREGLGPKEGSLWLDWLASATPEEMRRVMDACMNRMKTGNTFAPTLADCISFSSGIDEDVIRECFRRCTHGGQAVYQVEYECAREIGWECRTRLSAEQAWKRYRKLFTEKAAKDGLEKIPEPEHLQIGHKRDCGPRKRRLTNEEHKAKIAEIKEKLKATK